MIGQVAGKDYCPKCGQNHKKEHSIVCDDWCYCECGYWWKVRDGRIAAESDEPGDLAIQKGVGSKSAVRVKR